MIKIYYCSEGDSLALAILLVAKNPDSLTRCLNEAIIEKRR